MIVFTSQETLGRDSGGHDVILCRVIADTLSDLPTPSAYASDNITIAMGSRGYCIDTGKMYMLNSSGSWVEQRSMLCIF